MKLPVPNFLKIHSAILWLFYVCRQLLDKQGFEPLIRVFERVKAFHGLDRAVTVLSIQFS